MSTLMSEIQAAPLTLAQAAKLVPGRSRNASTLWRWARHGKTINGQRIRLEVLEVGRNLLTSEFALLRYFERCAQARHLEIPQMGDVHARAEEARLND